MRNQEKLNAKIQKAIIKFSQEQQKKDRKHDLGIHHPLPEEVKKLTKHNFFKKSSSTNLLEGLIQTYPIEKVIKMLKWNFGLTDENIEFQQFQNDGHISFIIGIILLNGETTHNDVGKIVHFMKKCGYEVSKKFHSLEEGSIYGIITFEPKFTKDISQDLRAKCHVLYHMTPCIYVDRIMHQGLVPRSHNSEYKYPDRVYLMNGDELNKKQQEILHTVKEKRDNSIQGTTNPNEHFKYALLTIALDLVPESVKFYTDTLAPYGVFTYDNLPPQSIINVQEIKMSTTPHLKEGACRQC